MCSFSTVIRLQSGPVCAEEGGGHSGVGGDKCWGCSKFEYNDIK